MTTDITELAQRMKTAAEKLDADQWQTRKGFSGIEVIVKGSLEKGHGCVSFQPVAADMADTKTARAIALFSPANVLALVEALESEKRICATWRKTAEANSEKLEKSEKTSEARREAIGRAHNMFVRERDRANAAEEALDKAQQVDEELCKLLPPGVEYMDPPDGGDVTPLEGVRRMVADYRQRIAELESRTVKMPEPFKLAKSSSGLTYYYADEVNEALSAAGIKWEGE